MSLTVLSVAYPLARVGPDAVGGAEQILRLIDSELVRQGHKSVVVACEGSEVKGELITTLPLPRRIDRNRWAAAHERHRSAIASALNRWPVDVVHFHGIDFAYYLPARDLPLLATLHMPLSWYPGLIYQKNANLHLLCVSSSQQGVGQNGAGNFLPLIENGVPLNELPLELEKESYVAAIGRICPEKGFHLALDAAEAAGVPILLAGEVFPYEEHRRYFQREIVPRLSPARKFLGPVGIKEKPALLGRARCLVVPSLAPETSCLAALEAMACGTPVVAFRTGALSESILDGETGFLVNDATEMAAAITRTGTLDPASCRRKIEERYSAERMTRAYIDLYHRLCRGEVDTIGSEVIAEPRARASGSACW